MRHAFVFDVLVSDGAYEVSDQSVPGMLHEVDPVGSPILGGDRYLHRFLIVGTLPYQRGSGVRDRQRPLISDQDHVPMVLTWPDGHRKLADHAIG